MNEVHKCPISTPHGRSVQNSRLSRLSVNLEFIAGKGYSRLPCAWGNEYALDYLVGDKRAARIGGDLLDRSGARPKPEPVQSQCRLLRIASHRQILATAVFGIIRSNPRLHHHPRGAGR